MKMKKRISVEKVLLTCLVGVGAAVFLLPLIWMLSSSLKTSMQVFASPFRWLEGNIRWKNYVEVWTSADAPFWRSLVNSLIVSIVSLTGQLVISSLAAFAFAKIPFKGRNVLFMMMLVTMMIPVQALIIPRYMVFYQLKIYDTLWSMILPNLFSVTSIFLLRQFYMGLPDELMEAALIDGAGYFRIWIKVMMPLTKNGLISTAILAFISSWNEYLSALVFLPSSENYTVALAIRWYIYDTAQQYNLAMCAAASAIIPIVIIYVTAQKYFEDGIAVSAVKG